MEPWEEYPEIWKTKSAFFSWLRGGLRRAIWEKYPPKIVFKNNKCDVPPESYIGKAKSGTYCALTGEWVPKSYLEVDHIKGNVSLREWEDTLPFVKHLCGSMDNFQLVSKEAHKIKSYAERKNISFDEAYVEKTAIKLINEGTDKDFFISRGLEVPKKKDRREAIIHILNAEKSI